LNDVELLSQLLYREQCQSAIRAEKMERTKAAAILAVLSASASYIAAPAVVSVALPKAKGSLPMTASIGVTFPFNLLIGIPTYLFLAQWLATVIS
ncbi:MAG: hypothetical protein EBU08_16810, partial [Micrococcales bacterium]|nr:hypothetical protein [Micrococcales bacterium]